MKIANSVGKLLIKSINEKKRYRLIKLFHYLDINTWGMEGTNILIYFSRPTKINCNIREL